MPRSVRAGMRLLRPTHAGRLTRTGLLAAGAVMAVSVGLGGAAFAASSLHAQYGAPHISVDTASWAGRAPTYARTACVRCHGDEWATGTTGAHGSVACQGCHVPSIAHPGSVAGVVVHLPALQSSLCTTCHQTTGGRPGDFPQVDPARHYRGAACLRCHDAHSARAARPPEVTHPLVDLPACTTCHAPDGLKSVPAGHELVEDGVCLSCHAPGAGRT